MINARSLMVSINFFALVSCAQPKDPTYSYHLETEEYILKTDSINRQFHSVLDRPELQFPGYLIGVEKSPKETIGAPEWSKHDKHLHYNPFPLPNTANADSLFSEMDESDPGPINKHISNQLTEPKRTYITHIIKYWDHAHVPMVQVSSNSSTAAQRTELYNLYKKIRNEESLPQKHKVARSGYESSWSAIDLLRDDIRDVIRARDVTHVFIYSMGWNTHQTKAIENYNDLFDDIYRRGKQQHDWFQPLFIGISWPSKWTVDENTFLRKTRMLFGYPANAYDADEVGFLWANHLLRNAIVPLKKETQFKLILVGHSFGARLLSRAVFSAPLLKGAKHPSSEDIDLFLAIQGAFSLSRFVPDSGIEGSPYAQYKDHAQHYVLTWSKNDAAERFGFWAPFAGSPKGHRFSKKHKNIFSQIQVDSNGNYCDSIAPIQSKKIVMANVSELLENHNDIYDKEMANFIWQLVDRLTISNSKSIISRIE